jgi:hypothetical protein
MALPAAVAGVGGVGCFTDRAGGCGGGPVGVVPRLESVERFRTLPRGVGRVLDVCLADAASHGFRMMSASSAEWSLRPWLRQAWW